MCRRISKKALYKPFQDKRANLTGKVMPTAFQNLFSDAYKKRNDENIFNSKIIKITPEVLPFDIKSK